MGNDLCCTNDQEPLKRKRNTLSAPTQPGYERLEESMMTSSLPQDCSTKIQAMQISLVKYNFCVHCGRLIEGEQFQTDCNHVLHQQCMTDLITRQFERKPTRIYLKCTCGKKITYIYLQKHSLVHHGQILKLNTLYQANKSKFLHCSRDTCHYFSIKDENEDKFYCPMCDILFNI